jgi:hypothetical protein
VSEAQACGVPCLVPDWSALGSDGGWPGDSVVRVACTNTALTAPMNGAAYTIGGVPDRVTFVSDLHALYSSLLHTQAIRQRGLRRSALLSWERTGEEFLRVVEHVVNGVPATSDTAPAEVAQC